MIDVISRKMLLANVDVPEKTLTERNVSHGFAVPDRLSDKLCDFLSVPHDTELSRTDVTRKVTSYIESKISSS